MTNPPALEEIPSELLEAIRVPLTSLWADAGYLVGRAINGERDFAVHAIKARCDEIERAVRAALTPLKGAAEPPWRPEVISFADAMERKLRDNDWKAGWKDDASGALMVHVREEFREFEAAHLAYPRGTDQYRQKLLDEGADAANMMMMVCDVCHALPPTPLLRTAEQIRSALLEEPSELAAEPILFVTQAQLDTLAGPSRDHRIYLTVRKMRSDEFPIPLYAAAQTSESVQVKGADK